MIQFYELRQLIEPNLTKARSKCFSDSSFWSIEGFLCTTNKIFSLWESLLWFFEHRSDELQDEAVIIHYNFIIGKEAKTFQTCRFAVYSALRFKIWISRSIFPWLFWLGKTLLRHFFLCREEFLITNAESNQKLRQKAKTKNNYCFNALF